MLFKPCKISEVLSGGIRIGLGGIFRATKQAEKYLKTANFNISAPLLRAFHPTNSLVSRFVVPLETCILLVLRLSCLAQIAKSIIGANYVYVVNLLGRPFSRHIEPRKAVAEVGTSIYVNFEIAPVAHATGDASSLPNRGERNLPCKNASVRTVVQDFVQAIDCEHILTPRVWQATV